MMNRKEMMTARETLIDCHCFSGNVTPAGTVADLVQRIGYEATREIVALAVIAKGEWDQRISEAARAWAFDLTGTTYGDLAARCFYYPDSIHPAHMDQIAAAMMAYQPEPEPANETQTEEPAGVEIVETRIMTMCDLRALCIEKEWYTYGDNEEYDRLLNRVYNSDGERAEMTPAKLYEIAQDIRNASDWHWTVESIMFELARICRSFFEVK